MFDPVAELLGPTDQRLAKYPLMASVLPTVFFSSIYLLFIKVLGPAWMKNKEPYDLRHFMMFYNCALVGINGWITVNYLRYGWLATYSWHCEPIDTSDNPIALKIVYTCWVFYISKLFEYLDTIIFVLRKKDSQINFLHVFHHTTVPVTAWLGVSYGPGPIHVCVPVLHPLVAFRAAELQCLNSFDMDFSGAGNGLLRTLSEFLSQILQDTFQNIEISEGEQRI